MAAEDPRLIIDLNYTFKEYMLVISPSTALTGNLEDIKKQYHRLFGRAKRLWSKPHISLCRFILAEYLENVLKMELQQFLHSRQTFQVNIRGVKSFSNNRLLFVQPDKENINKLQYDMLTVLRNRVRVGRSFIRKLREPHLTVALAYDERQFQRSWEHFSKMNFKGSFTVDKITVLSRPYSHSSPEPWQRLFELPIGDKK